MFAGPGTAWTLFFFNRSAMQMSCILITGGAGYIGSHAVYAFIEAGHEVVVIDDLSTGVRANLPEGAIFYEGNIGDRQLITQVARSHQPEGVLHFAGSVVVPESVTHPAKYYRNNAYFGLELLDAIIECGIRYFLFSSTAAVYGIPERAPVAESAPLQPINPYGWSKLFFEQQLRDLAATRGLNFGILRYFNVAGADPSGRTGQGTPAATHLIKVACEVATGKRAGISVFGSDYPTRDGTCIRDFIHVTDLVGAHVAVYRHIRRSRKSVIFNCGSGEGYSVLGVLRTVEKESGCQLKIEIGGRRPGDPPTLIADPTLLLSSLAWQPKHTLANMVETALAWERRHGHCSRIKPRLR
jgi:UDP-glucose 4-epimerase